jgi:hypothetical protein
MDSKKRTKLSELSGMKKLELEKLSELKGGIAISLLNGCESYVCAESRPGAADLCKGGAWCTSGVGP